MVFVCCLGQVHNPRAIVWFLRPPAEEGRRKAERRGAGQLPGPGGAPVQLPRRQGHVQRDLQVIITPQRGSMMRVRAATCASMASLQGPVGEAASEPALPRQRLGEGCGTPRPNRTRRRTESFRLRF